MNQHSEGPPFFAHTREGRPSDEWEPLEEHLQQVAALAEEFASVFDSALWGKVAGLWHDLGKYHPRFQQRLKDDTIRQPHAGAGAAHAVARDPRLGKFLAWPIAGHHAGLANDVVSGDGLPKPLRDRIEDAHAAELSGALPNVPLVLHDVPIPGLPSWLTDGKPDPSTLKYRIEMWIRFLFSALVDADRLATERFCDLERAERRTNRYDNIPELRRRLEERLAAIEEGLCDEQRSRPINRARQGISRACASKASESPGLFSLTVPTGGGKTLAAMRFALMHAETHNLRRIIVVIPYTSIIEQNASRYAEIFGPENVVEHHSNLDPERRREQLGDDILLRHELAAENWDAPVIVTTTVQFFESLFSNQPSRCRKLHNIARSVIILDEVQSLPTGFLLTILDGLRQLTSHYGCSVVLSTATPPALKRREALPQGLEDVREIVEDPVRLALNLRRVEYVWPELEAPAREWEDLALELARFPQVLAVTHRRADARTLAEALEKHVDQESVYHLSALMCPAHRTDVLKRVRRALDEQRPCRLISTQLIEAGVDVDFPVVYRALAGLDAVVQAAGRCNREGRANLGKVVVFRAPTKPPAGALSRGFDAAATMLTENTALDADNPETQELYFRRLYRGSQLDAKNILRERASFSFATVGRDFKLIEDGFTQPIIVPWGEGAERLDRLKRALMHGGMAGKDLFRSLQPFTVSVYEKWFQQARDAGALEEVCEGLFALRATHRHHYDQKYGLVTDDDLAILDTSSTIL